MSVIRVAEYLDEFGRSPFRKWFADLDAEAAARVTTALYRLGLGNFSSVQGAGRVYEYRIDFGPGYRIYFGKDGEALVVLLGGSTKKRQQQAIRTAEQHWTDYKRRKAGK